MKTAVKLDTGMESIYKNSKRGSTPAPFRRSLVFPYKIPKIPLITNISLTQANRKFHKNKKIKNLPLFLREYLNCPIPASPKKVEKKKHDEITLQLKPAIKTNLSLITKKNYPKNAKLTPEKLETVGFKPMQSNFYKAYNVQLSPRAKIRLYSTTPIYCISQANETKVKKKKLKLNKNNSISSNITPELKAVPVIVTEYTKSFPEKLKKISDLCEAARIEANNASDKKTASC